MARSLSKQGVSTMPLVFSSALFVLSLCSLTSAEERVATNEPQFVSRGGEVRVKEGHTAELSCEVSDLGEFVLLWKFNRSVVLFAGNLRIHRDDRIARNDSTGALTIKDFRPENAGEYTCQVSTNPPQDITYQVHLLGPPHIAGEPRVEVTARRWEAVQLTCDTQAEHVLWRRETRVLGSGRAFSLERVEREDAGSYTCTASNEMGQSQREFRLRVLFPPEVTVPSEVVHAPIGQPVTVQCVVSAEPSANVNWFRANGQKVMPNERMTIDRNDSVASFKLTSVTTEDYDQYSCVANNSLGSAVQRVNVTGKPSLPVFTSAPLAGRASSYLLEWTLESETPITEYVVKWKARDADTWSEERVRPTDESQSVQRSGQFEVTSLEADQSYDVEVHAHNHWGVTRSDVFAFVTSWAHVTAPSLAVALTLALSVHSFQ